MTKTYSMIFLEPGDKVLIAHRRLFVGDRTRYFIGTVDGFNEANGLLKVTGHTFCPGADGHMARKKDRRTKILSATSGALIIYQLAKEIDVDKVTLTEDGRGGTRLTDDRTVWMDLSETAH